MIIKWTNKYSHEIGYVGSVSTKNKCFYNSDKDNAKQYKNEKSAIKAIALLKEYGEADNNDFEIVTA